MVRANRRARPLYRRHEKHGRDHRRARRAEEVRRDGRRHEAASGLGRRDRELQSGGREAHGRSERERDREPKEAAEDVALVLRNLSFAVFWAAAGQERRY